VRKFGKSFVALWKKELTKAGTLHLHAMVFWMVAPPELSELRAFNDEAWLSAAQAVDAAPTGKALCELDVVRSWNGVSSYASKYLSKPAGLVLNFPTGRVWGWVNRKAVPITEVVEALPPRAGNLVRRTLRRLLERRRARLLYRCSRNGWREVPERMEFSRGERITGVEKVAQALSRFIDVKFCRRRARVTRTVFVPIFARVTDDQQMFGKHSRRRPLECVAVEPTDILSSLHFLEDQVLARLVAWGLAEAERLDDFDRWCP
jgi:hypothetical protein